MDTVTPGVIFDLDGTLVDSEPFWTRGFSSGLSSILAARGHGDHPLQVSDMHQFHGGRVPDTVRAILAWLELDTDLDEDEITTVVDETIRYVTEDFLARPVAIAEAVTTARALHADGVPLGLASSSASDFIDAALRALQLEDVFPVRVSAMEMPHGKPNPAVYYEILDRMGVPAGRALAIEDSIVGVAAALNAGMRCVWFRSPGLEGASPPDFARDAGALDELVDAMPAAYELVTETTSLNPDLVVNLLDKISRETIEP